MIVCLRLEVTDEERSVLSLRSHPKALKRLATGAEMKALIAEQWANNLSQDDVIAETTESVPAIEEQIMPGNVDAPVVATVKPIKGIRKLVHHVNCAMFSLSHARRMAATYSTDSEYQLNKLVKDVEMLRDDLAAEHDKVCESDE